MKSAAYLIMILIMAIPLTGCLNNAENGEAGIQGEQGEIGPEGPPGQDGFNGNDGLNGTDGITGPPGADGQNGSDGADGINGQNGTNGLDGADGLNSLIDLVEEAAGENCKNGGLRVNSGLDDNRDGILQLEEIDDFSFICQPSNMDNQSDGITVEFGEDAILGSWRSPMKHNTVTLTDQLGACVEHDAWVRTNESAMMEMMNDTNQNTYAAHVGGPVGGCEYLSLLDLLDAANHSDEQRNIWIGLKNWQSMPQYVSLIENYSTVPVETHVGKGIIIDDYGEMIYNPWTTFGEMNNSDLQDLKDATVVSGQSQAQIIPYIGAKHAVMFGGESAVLGVGPCAADVNDCDAGNNYTLEVNDKISVTWNYTVAANDNTAGYLLQGIVYDTYNKTFNDRDLLLNISLNGNVVNSFNLSGNDEYGGGLMLLDTELPDLLVGQNEITFSLNATGNRVTRTHNKLAFITDLSITNTESEITKLDIGEGWYQKQRFSPNANPNFHHSQPNTAWVQSDYVDGFLFKWVAPNEGVDPVLHERFLKWFCGNLQAQDKLCIQAFWGDKQWMINSPGNASHYVSMLENLADFSDGLLVWRMDNQQYDMHNGIYAETRAADETYYIAGMYPAYMPATEDWFQQWEFNTHISGLLEIEINDFISNTALQGRMLVTVIIDETEVYVHDLGDAELQSTFSTQVNAGTNVKIKFHTIDSFGSVNWWTGIDVQLNSGPIAMADLSYISGSSDHIAFIYNLMTATFLGEDLSDFYNQ